MKKTIIRFLLFTLLAMLAVVYLVKRPSLSWGEVVLLPEGASSEVLKSHVRFLSEELTNRNHSHLSTLNQAAEYISQNWQSHGLQVSRQSFVIDGTQYHNVIARLGPQQGELVVVGAHYDTFDLLPGADDNASGVAGLLELGRLLAADPPEMPIELVAFTLEEPPYFASQNMGSAHHAQALKEPVRLMVSLEMIGYFSDQPDSQKYPLAVLSWLYPTTGDFIAVVDQLFSSEAQSIKQVYNQHTSLAAHSINAPASLVGVDFSDHRNYWAQNIPAVMITDTAFYRNHYYHTENDTWERLNYQKMAQVIDGLLIFLQHGLD
ncbi:M28 family peptidase [Marinicella sediminis]|uniref:M28 family peptidase n=1 Tax=Marinicella sediminis TaxID=1792834 RepID=A0ABV7JCI0_9GAMM|nr:M28 family peptidase [Marinicella sediminis]